MKAVLLLLVTVLVIGCTNSDDFMKACKGVGKSEAQCRYEWESREFGKPKDGGGVIVMPMPSGR